MKITFYGAARQVTGSMFLLELEHGYKILIDCGVDFENKGSDNRFPFNPSEIDLVLLTHAHLDHSGRIPSLYLQGYNGQILCTSATFALTQLILHDAAAIQSKNIKRKLNRQKYNSRKVADADYLQVHVDKAAERFVTIAFNNPFQVDENLIVNFIPTGHLLGAANIILEIKESGEYKKICFSGDIGRKKYPLLEEPFPVPEVDYLVCESTYGDRLHQDNDKPEEILIDVIRKTCIEKKGRLIIPSFSVGRTQALLYTLNKLAIENKLPAIKVFADSPMAEACTRIYENHLHILNKEAKEFYKINNNLFDFSNLIQIQGSKESKAISNYSEPCIILSSSGMITGGRIQEHIRKNLSNQYCTVLLVGYSAEGTTGHSLYKGEKIIFLNGKAIPVQAEIIHTDVFSGHGDQKDLINYIKPLVTPRLKRIFLVHGEEKSMHALKDKILDIGYEKIEMPEKGEEFLI